MKSVGDFTWWELLLTVWFIAYLSKLTLLVGQWEGHSAIKTCAIYPQSSSLLDQVEEDVNRLLQKTDVKTEVMMVMDLRGSLIIDETSGSLTDVVLLTVMLVIF